MKSVFSVRGDNDGSIPSPSFNISVCFNGVPDTVILEVHRTDSEMHLPLMRAVLKASHARAIASALLSAATETR